MSSVAVKLESIAKKLGNARGFDRVVIGQGADFSCEIKNNLWSWLPAIFSCLFPYSFKRDNRETFSHFFQIFGEKRIFAIGKRYGLDLEGKYARGLSLTQRDVRLLCVGAADVRREDIDTLFKEEQRVSSPLYCRLQGKKSVEDLSKADLDVLYQMLVPFAKIEHIFLNHLPEVTPFSSRDDSLSGRTNRVFLIEQMRRNGSYYDEVLWKIRLSKRIVNEDLAKGVIIPHPQGYYEHRALIQGGGAYKLLLRPLNTETGLHPIIAYLSTRFSGTTMDSILSRLESLRQNIGENGVKATYLETKSYLDNVTKGFVRSPEEKVDLIGMSLGGAQASRDACLFKERVASLTTICAPGIDEATCQWFATVSQRFPQQMSIHHMVEKDDVVPDLGQAHLGIYCPPEKVKVRHTTFLPSDAKMQPIHPMHLPSRPEAPEEIRHMFLELFINSMIYAHSRETTAKTHYSTTLSNEEGEETRTRLNKILHNAKDPLRRRWEDIRQTIAKGEPKAFFRFLLQH
jgi:hypothetical protein